jgi:hypothetical protein
MLSDFGDLGFRADLDALLDALNHDAQLHAPGRLALRRIMTDHLVNRLLLTSVRQQAPGIFTRPLANPPGRHGAHQYPLDAGLPPAEVAAAFHPYRQSWPSGPTIFSHPS